MLDRKPVRKHVKGKSHRLLRGVSFLNDWFSRANQNRRPQKGRLLRGKMRFRKRCKKAKVGKKKFVAHGSCERFGGLLKQDTRGQFAGAFLLTHLRRVAGG